MRYALRDILNEIMNPDVLIPDMICGVDGVNLLTLNFQMGKIKPKVEIRVTS